MACRFVSLLAPAVALIRRSLKLRSFRLCLIATLVSVPDRALAQDGPNAGGAPPTYRPEPDRVPHDEEVRPIDAATGFDVVEPMPHELGYATGGNLPWQPRGGVLGSGAVVLTIGYVLGIALGTLDLELQPGSSCDDTIGGLHAIPVFGPIAGWAMLGTCRPQLDPLIHGLLELPPAALQMAGFILVLVGAAGRRGRVAIPRVAVTSAGAGIAIDF